MTAVKANPRLSEADQATLTAARQVLHDVATTDHGDDLVALQWDLDALHGALGAILAVVERVSS